MSTDTFEHDLATRLGSATETITADGVTRDAVEDRIVARRATARRRRQGTAALAAAALVVVAGIGALALGSDEPRTTVRADQGGSTTEAPSTEPPTTDAPTTTECETAALPGSVQTGPCPAPPPPPSTEAPTPTGPPGTTAPGTTGPPATDAPATTAVVPDTQPPTSETTLHLVPGDPCALGSDPDCIDPDGDGQGTYLIGGAACMATQFNPSMCEDLDGDGEAGYPDSQ